uniref:Uncharacterized protein n=1 Tax=Romanomermis culicivorax TaxID=13658 RepID=A0A915JUI5_ROMCU
MRLTIILSKWNGRCLPVAFGGAAMLTKDEKMMRISRKRPMGMTQDISKVPAPWRAIFKPMASGQQELSSTMVLKEKRAKLTDGNLQRNCTELKLAFRSITLCRLHSVPPKKTVETVYKGTGEQVIRGDTELQSTPTSKCDINEEFRQNLTHGVKIRNCQKWCPGHIARCSYVLKFEGCVCKQHFVRDPSRQGACVPAEQCGRQDTGHARTFIIVTGITAVAKGDAE